MLRLISPIHRTLRRFVAARTRHQRLLLLLLGSLALSLVLGWNDLGWVALLVVAGFILLGLLVWQQTQLHRLARRVRQLELQMRQVRSLRTLPLLPPSRPAPQTVDWDKLPARSQTKH